MTNGKGSSRRPAALSEQEQRSRWAATFGGPVAESDTVTHCQGDDTPRPQNTVT